MHLAGTLSRQVDSGQWWSVSAAVLAVLVVRGGGAQEAGARQ